MLQRGEPELRHNARTDLPRRLVIAEPKLLHYRRPLAHEFHNSPEEGSDFVCAELEFDGGEQRAGQLELRSPQLVRHLFIDQFSKVLAQLVFGKCCKRLGVESQEKVHARHPAQRLMDSP